MFDGTILDRWALTPKARQGTIVALVTLYSLSFPVIYPYIDHWYFIIGIVPIIAAGVLLGFRIAIYTVIAISVTHFGLLAGPLGHPPGKAFVESFPIVTLLIGGTIGYLRDLRVELAQHRNELKRRNEHLDEFASVVSHDLRNPLNVATGRVELAREECDTEHLEPVAKAHDRMASLIDDTLTLARSGKVVSETEEVDLSALGESSWHTVETTEATLVTETDRVIRADKARLQQLLENLIRNAVEHSEQAVTVTIGDLPDGFYIEDDGPGIPEGERETVFDTGYSTTETGSGLGLSIVKRITEAHGWTVHVTEGSNGGARFEFTGVSVVG